MFRNAISIVAALLWLAGTSAASAQEVQTPERAIPGRYIVVLDDQQVARGNVQALADALARQHGGRVASVYEHAIRGFAATMSATGAAALARSPRVRYVEQDSERFIVDAQLDATWGLDRIDQRDLPLNGSYTYTTLAANVNVYVIDTGIRSTHAEFGGRVSSTGYTAISDGRGTTDCNGHGTHVAGTIGGVYRSLDRGRESDVKPLVSCVPHHDGQLAGVHLGRRRRDRGGCRSSLGHHGQSRPRGRRRCRCGRSRRLRRSPDRSGRCGWSGRRSTPAGHRQ